MTRKVTVNDFSQPGILCRCFELESYFVDDSFFDFLMKQVYEIWDSFQPYTTELPDSRLFYLYVPWQLIPEKFAINPNFCRDWVSHNNDIDIIIKSRDDYTCYTTKAAYTTNEAGANATITVTRSAAVVKGSQLAGFAPVGALTWSLAWDRDGHLHYFISKPTYQQSDHIPMLQTKTISPPTRLADTIDLTMISLPRTKKILQSQWDSKRRR